MWPRGKAVKPASFGDRPECTTIRKSTVFQLQPGRRVLLVSANAEPKLKIMVTPKP